MMDHPMPLVVTIALASLTGWAMHSAVPRWYVNEYEERRRYGGPEEGGWWFDAGHYITCHGAYPFRSMAVRRWRRLQSYVADLRADRHKPGNVLCSGWPVLYVENAPGASWPDRRPRYE